MSVKRGLTVKGVTKFSNIGTAPEVCTDWSQKTIAHCLSLLPIVSRLGYRANWPLGLGGLPKTHKICRHYGIKIAEFCLRWQKGLRSKVLPLYICFSVNVHFQTSESISKSILLSISSTDPSINLNFSIFLYNSGERKEAAKQFSIYEKKMETARSVKGSDIDQEVHVFALGPLFMEVGDPR